MTPPPRSPQQRRQDTLDRLERDVDAWVATADGGSLLIATPSSSPTGQNLQSTGKVRVGIGPTRDLVLIEGTVGEILAAAEVPDEVGDAFAAKTGFDPRQLTGYSYFRLHPQRLQAWREANELGDRELMRGGQ